MTTIVAKGGWELQEINYFMTPGSHPFLILGTLVLQNGIIKAIFQTHGFLGNLHGDN